MFLYQEPVHWAIQEALLKDEDVNVHSDNYMRPNYEIFIQELTKVPNKHLSDLTLDINELIKYCQVCKRLFLDVGDFKS